jgi:hypothetical protein
MHIEVISLSPRDSFGMTLVKVSVTAKRETDTTDGGFIEVSSHRFNIRDPP